MAELERLLESGHEKNHAEGLLQERKRQVRGLLLLAFAVLLFSILRFGVDRVFTPGWWRMW
jgi:hypothetical protein